MALVSSDEAKTYLRVDSSDEDALIDILLSSAVRLCADVARISAEQWDAIDAVSYDEDGNVLETETDLYTEEELASLRGAFRVAILFSLGYLYEHREEADHRQLALTLRALLFAAREGVF